MEPSSDVDIALRDAEIHGLKVRIEGYRTKISLSQQELTLAYDKIDQIQMLHTRELEQGLNATKHVKDQLRRHQKHTKQIERERDDLRDAVLELISKVESTQGGLNSWPRSDINMKSFLDPVTNLDQPLHGTSADAPELLSYAAARIISLAQQRDLERQTYARMQKVHESQVRTLHAQIARRDATIAAFRENGINIPNLQLNSKDKPQQPDYETNSSMSEEEITRIMRKTEGNNHRLEMEVRMLGARLEQARLSSIRPPSPPQGAPLSHEMHALHTIRHDPNPNLRPETLSQAQPGGLEPNAQIVFADTQHSNQNNLPTAMPDLSPTYSNEGVTNIPRPNVVNRPHLQQIGTLDHQINLLSSKIDAFREERSRLKQAIASQQSEPTSAQFSSLAGRRARVMEDTHISSQLTELEQQQNEHQSPGQSEPARALIFLEEATQSWSALDANIDGPITAMPLGADITNHDAHLREGLENYDLDSNGELSMDIATPLIQVNLTLPADAISRSSRTQSPLTSNEESPRMIRPRILPSPRPTTPDSLSSSSNQSISVSPKSEPLLTHTPAPEVNLERVQKELTEARHRLDKANQEIADLRAILQAIQEKGALA